MKLRLGKMTTKELAQWFGLSYGGFRNSKEDKLEELRDYADFEEVYGGIEITAIKNEEYIKGGSKAKKIILGALDEEWDESGLDNCKNVSKKIYRKHKNELMVEQSTAYRYTLDARNMLYGKPFTSAGQLGQCIYLWCKVYYNEDGSCILKEFTQEEQEIKKKLMKKYFSTDEEKELLIREMVEAGEITKEEAYDLSCELKGLNQAGFMSFKADLEYQLGCQITKGTLLIKDAEQQDFNNART